MLWVTATQLLLSMVRRCGQSCMQKLWSAQAVLSLYGMLECKLCREIVLLLNVADILYARRLVSEQ